MEEDCDASRIGLPKDDVEAVKWWRKAVDQGFPQAQANLGTAYELGFGGLSKNDDLTLKLFRASADKGNAMGQYNLAITYINGYGVPQDISKAIKLLRNAADQGYPSVQSAITTCGVTF